MFQMDDKKFIVFNDLLASDPEFSKLFNERLLSRIKDQKDQLAAMEEVARAGVKVTGRPRAKAEGRPAANGTSKADTKASATNTEDGKRPGRPSGSSSGHGEAILNVLRSASDEGVTAREIINALTSSGHQATDKTILTYLAKMKQDKKIEASGTRRNMKYTLPRS